MLIYSLWRVIFSKLIYKYALSPSAPRYFHLNGTKKHYPNRQCVRPYHWDCMRHRLDGEVALTICHVSLRKLF